MGRLSLDEGSAVNIYGPSSGKFSRGEVQFTVMQRNRTDLKEAELKNWKVRAILGQTQKVAWAVRKNSPELLATLNCN